MPADSQIHHTLMRQSLIKGLHNGAVCVVCMGRKTEEKTIDGHTQQKSPLSVQIHDPAPRTPGSQRMRHALRRRASFHTGRAASDLLKLPSKF